MSNIFKIDIKNWNESFNLELQNEAMQNLEDGKILFLPNLSFELNEEEMELTNSNAFDLSAKSIKYNSKEGRIWGICNSAKEILLKNLMQRYTESSINLIKNLLPFYQNSIEVGNSSFRPIEAQGRVQSKKHDDTKLHIDAFPSRPINGRRLLRVFANINTEGAPRVWNAGEPFDKVADTFLPQIPSPIPFLNHALKALKITKSLRTKYDHYMLYLHDKMKLDDGYQANASKERIEFNAGSVWVCFSDKTSHSALSGRGLLEQTIYLDYAKMLNPQKSPLKILEQKLNQKLI